MKQMLGFFKIVLLAAMLTLLTVTIVSAVAPFVVKGTANVNGDPSEWDLANDFFANMYKAANPNKEVLAKLYLRYDCQTQTLYALVLVESGHTIAANVGPGEHYLKRGVTSLVNDASGNDGTPPDFAWINKRIGSRGVAIADGWEASAPLAIGTYNNLNAHTDVDWTGSEWDTAAVENRSIQMNIVCTPSAVTLSSFGAQADTGKDWGMYWLGLASVVIASLGMFLLTRH